jgi:hypothetical protein
VPTDTGCPKGQRVTLARNLFLVALMSRETYYVYISPTKMDELAAAFQPSLWSRFSTNVGLSFAPVNFGVTLRERPEKQSAVRARIEKELLERGKLAQLGDPLQ